MREYGWISCAEKMPNTNELVHVFMNYENYTNSTKDVYTDRMRWSKNYDYQPTHWKPVYNMRR